MAKFWFCWCVFPQSNIWWKKIHHHIQCKFIFETLATSYVESSVLVKGPILVCQTLIGGLHSVFDHTIADMVYHFLQHMCTSNSICILHVPRGIRAATQQSTLHVLFWRAYSSWNHLPLSLGVYRHWWDQWWEEAMKGLGLAMMDWYDHWWDQWLMGSVLGPAIKVWWDPWWRSAIDVLMDIFTIWSDQRCLMYDMISMYSLWLGLSSVCI